MKFCPHCGGDISKYMAAETPSSAPSAAQTTTREQRAYDQTATWKRILARANEVQATPPRIEAIVMGSSLVSDRSLPMPLLTIVHIAFDRSIVPSGGVLYRAMMLDGRTKTSPGQLAAMGYAVEDGSVKTVNDVPVGRAYTVLDYWGGAKQHKRWHLVEPVTIEPSRNGDPFFMDENMLAFGARWRDGELMEEGLGTLLELFAQGINGDEPVAQPLALELVAKSW